MLPDGLIVHVYPAFSLTGGLLDAVDGLGTICAVFSPVGFRNKNCFADVTVLCIVFMEDFRFQCDIRREKEPPEPPAENGIRNALYAHTGLSIVQQNTVSAVVIAALLSYQGVGSFSLLWRHEWWGTVWPAFNGWLLFQ